MTLDWSCKYKAICIARLSVAVAVAVMAAAVVFAPPASGEDARRLRGAAPDRITHEIELQGIEETLHASEEQRRKIEAEIEAIKADRLRLNAALIETAAVVKRDEDSVGAMETQLRAMMGSEDAIRRSLDSRRAVVAEVLASLQRMGGKPLPALLARPEDVVESIRAAMLLGSVLPELRAESEALASDLADLLTLRKSITAARDGLAQHGAALSLERLRLGKLIEAKRGLLAEAESAMASEKARAAELARSAGSLKDLIAKIENEIAAAQNAAELARRAEDAQRLSAEADAAAIQKKLDAGAFRDAARLSPAIPFGDARGQLPAPVSGAVVKLFGSGDGFGGLEKGQSFKTFRKASVVSPTDGWVSYAGPYRTYGQLLIINAGGGYYVVLAGMSSVNVDAGQFVLMGEPVAFMGEKSARSAAAIAIGAVDPVLYVEFRKDGIPIDPGPWWTKSETQKVSG